MQVQSSFCDKHVWILDLADEHALFFLAHTPIANLLPNKHLRTHKFRKGMQCGAYILERLNAYAQHPHLNLYIQMSDLTIMFAALLHNIRANNPRSFDDLLDTFCGLDLYACK